MGYKLSKIGKRGTLVIPAALRKRFGLREGDLLIAEGTDRGILLRPAAAVPVEVYTKERIAEFLLNNAVDEADYQGALEEVRRLGVDPDTVPQSWPWRRSEVTGA